MAGHTDVLLSKDHDKFGPAAVSVCDAGPSRRLPIASHFVASSLAADDLPLIGERAVSERRRTVRYLPCSTKVMSDDKGATEEEVQKIDVIRGSEVLGYDGAGREEHSGENKPREQNDLRGELADNTKKDIEGS